MAARVYALDIEPNYEQLRAVNQRYLKALAVAHPVEAHELVRRASKHREREQTAALHVMEAQVDRLIVAIKPLTNRVEELERAAWPSVGPQVKIKRPAIAIASHVAAKHNIAVSTLFSRSRSRPIVQARQEAMYLCVRKLQYSLPQVGRIFGRDHTTVMHSCRAHSKRTGERPVVSEPRS